MKRLFYIFASLLLFGVTDLWSQDKQNSELTFYYVTHDRQTNVQALTHELQQAFDDLKEYDNAGIFYLANGEEPIIVSVNLPNENEKEFPHLIGEMQEKLAHDISADYDVNRILTLFERTPFVNDDGNLLYKSVNWNYYVTSSFWTMLYNESIIGTLYWTMDMQELQADQEFYMNILRSSDDIISFDNGLAMGVKNYNGINDKIAIVTY